MWTIARLEATKYSAKNTTFATASAIPAGSPSGPVVPARITSAAPTAATKGPQAEGHAGALAEEHQGEDTDQNGLKHLHEGHVDHRRGLDGDHEEQLVAPKTTPAAVHCPPRRLKRSPPVRPHHRVRVPRNAAPIPSRQKERTAPEVDEAATRTGPMLNSTTPIPSMSRRRSPTAVTTAVCRFRAPASGLTTGDRQPRLGEGAESGSPLPASGVFI